MLLTSSIVVEADNFITTFEQAQMDYAATLAQATNSLESSFSRPVYEMTGGRSSFHSSPSTSPVHSSPRLYVSQTSSIGSNTSSQHIASPTSFQATLRQHGQATPTPTFERETPVFLESEHLPEDPSSTSETISPTSPTLPELSFQDSSFSGFDVDFHH
jgi:hypothetical protein